MRVVFSSEEYHDLIEMSKKDGVKSMGDFDCWIRETYLTHIDYGEPDVVDIVVEY